MRSHLCFYAITRKSDITNGNSILLLMFQLEDKALFILRGEQGVGNSDSQKEQSSLRAFFTFASDQSPIAALEERPLV